MQRSVTKVKHREGGKVLVHYGEFDENGHQTEFTVNSDDKPEPELPGLLKKLVPFIGTICEVRQLSAGATVIGVSWKFEESGNWGVTITALRKLDDCNSPLVINTPYKRADDPQGAEYSLPAECVVVLAQLAEAALRYVDGHREQMMLELGDAA